MVFADLPKLIVLVTDIPLLVHVESSAYWISVDKKCETYIAPSGSTKSAMMDVYMYYHIIHIKMRMEP